MPNFQGRHWNSKDLRNVGAIKVQCKMTLIGAVDPYVPGTSFSNYVEMVEYFFSSNNIEVERRKDIFLVWLVLQYLRN